MNILATMIITLSFVFNIDKDAFVYYQPLEIAVDTGYVKVKSQHIITKDVHSVYLVENDVMNEWEKKSVKSIVPTSDTTFIVNYNESHNSLFIYWSEGRTIEVKEFTIDWRDLDSSSSMDMENSDSMK